jgi:hypothetical protein
MVVPVQASLSLTSRWLTRVIAVAYLLLGLIMFVARAGPRIISVEGVTFRRDDDWQLPAR